MPGSRSTLASTELYDFVHANINLDPDNLYKKLVPGQKLLDNRWAAPGVVLVDGIRDRLIDITKYLVPAVEAIDQKAKSLGRDLHPAGRSRTVNAVKRYSVIPFGSDDLDVRTRSTQVTSRDYSNATGVVTIYYTEQRGAFVVYGGIRERFLALGGPASYLGFPTSGEDGNDKQGNDNVRWSHFDGGTLYWTPQRGTYAEVSVNAVTQRYETWRLTALDVTGLAPGSQFNVYGLGMYDLPETKRQGFGFAGAGPDGTYYGFGVSETHILSEADLAKQFLVVEQFTNRSGRVTP